MISGSHASREEKNGENCGGLVGCKEGLFEHGHLNQKKVPQWKPLAQSVHQSQREGSWCEGLRMEGAVCI